LDKVNAAEPGKPGMPEIIAALEQQLAALDRIGAHIAAAHLDAAIQQLRLEQARTAAS
jgi:hypothetical protein